MGSLLKTFSCALGALIVVSLGAVLLVATAGSALGHGALTSDAGPASPQFVAQLMATDGPTFGQAPTPAQVAVEWALSKVGTPYVWGGESDAGFDCSGLVQAAFFAAGIVLPRVAQQQYDAGPLVAGSASYQAVNRLVPGDLVFFGSGPASVDHVGIYVGSSYMVDAPHTGAVVRVEQVWATGYVGATDPAGT